MSVVYEVLFLAILVSLSIRIAWYIRQGLRREEERLADTLQGTGWDIEYGGDSLGCSGVPMSWVSFPKWIRWRRPLAVKETADFRAAFFGVMPGTRAVLAVKLKKTTYPRISLVYREHLAQCEQWRRSHRHLTSSCPGVTQSWIARAWGDKELVVDFVSRLDRARALESWKWILAIETYADWIVVTSVGWCSRFEDTYEFAVEAARVLEAAGIPWLFESASEPETRLGAEKVSGTNGTVERQELG